MTPDDIYKTLGSDSVELTPELFAEAAKSPEVLEKLKALVTRAASQPSSLGKIDTNRVSWAAYVFAENGSKAFAAPLFALCDTKAEPARKFAGAYADLDLPVIFVRLAGKEVVNVFGQLVQTYGGAAEVRVAAIRAAGAAWAHGLISRREALTPLVEELSRMCDETYAEVQDDEWFDTLLDVALELNPDGLEDALEALREYWDMQDDWDAELEDALEESLDDAQARLREIFPLYTHAMQFIDRWDVIDSAEDDAE